MSNGQLPGTRVSMDFTVPLWGVITVVGGGFVMLVGLFFNVTAMNTSVQKLQDTVQAGNTTSYGLDRRTNLLEFRVQNHDEELRKIQARNQLKDTRQ